VSVRLLLIRHGRVDFDSRDFVETPRGPQWDPPLDEEGRGQARRLAPRLSSMERPAAVFVSPLRRCIQTAEPFLQATGIEGTIDDGLREVHIGGWEGVRFEDLIRENIEAVRRRINDNEPVFELAPGGESGEELRARVVPAVERMLAPIEHGNVVMVTHGGVINAYLGHVMGLPQAMFFLPDNSSINTVEVEGDERRVVFLNDAAHLAFPAIFEAPAGAEVEG
jgi:probable phosphoglycerate mutase